MRSDARKRMHPAPHHDPAVVGLIEKARAEAVAPFVALAEEFSTWAEWTNYGIAAGAYKQCADAIRERAGGVS